MKRICTICARAGSKGVKDKNIRDLLGHPLVAHSIMQAKATLLFDCIAISSDSAKILQIGKDYGSDLQIIRPDELSSDAAPKIPSSANLSKAILTIETAPSTIFSRAVIIALAC